MTTQVSTLMPVSSLSELKEEWRVLAFRPSGHGEWRWYVKLPERGMLQKMIADNVVICAHRRDGDGTRMLAKVASKRR